MFQSKIGSEDNREIPKSIERDDSNSDRLKAKTDSRKLTVKKFKLKVIETQD